mgnify:CR=1 FL=1
MSSSGLTIFNGGVGTRCDRFVVLRFAGWTAFTPWFVAPAAFFSARSTVAAFAAAPAAITTTTAAFARTFASTTTGAGAGTPIVAFGGGAAPTA